MSFQVAIDGPAGAGKSTIAKRLAKELNFVYVDTGAMYRALALYMLNEDVALAKEAEVTEALPGADVSITYEDGVQHIILNGEDVSEEIRREDVGNGASTVSAYPAVREKLLSMQRNLAQTSDVVMDGRDIGTVVLPDAQAKIYLDASVEVRADRRFMELERKGEEADLMQIRVDIEQRDYQDKNRAIAPLKQAEDAYYLDSSSLTIEEVVEEMKKVIAEKRS